MSQADTVIGTFKPARPSFHGNGSAVNAHQSPRSIGSRSIVTPSIGVESMDLTLYLSCSTAKNTKDGYPKRLPPTIAPALLYLRPSMISYLLHPFSRGVFPRSEHHFAADLKGVKKERKSKITLGDFEQRCFCDSRCQI